MPNCIDLFAGVGGFSLGFTMAGFDVVAAIEIKKSHCETHHKNFPNTLMFCDSITNLTGDLIKQRLGTDDIDVVIGGAPCQGFSVAGLRAFDDPRNLLVAEYARMVKELQPKYCVFENVKGLTMGEHAQFLSELIAELTNAGYDILPYRVLNAADYGVPQNRLRLFIIGARRGLPMPVYPESMGAYITVRDAIEDLEEVPSLGQTHSIEVSQRYHLTPVGKREAISHHARLRYDKPCDTIRTNPCFIHPTLDRVLNIKELARLHSYPDNFQFSDKVTIATQQIGNSVPPLLAKAIGLEIRKMFP